MPEPVAAPAPMPKPAYVIIRFAGMVYRIASDQLGQPLPKEGNELIYSRTAHSPFLHRLQFAGAYDDLSDVGTLSDGGQGSEGPPPPPPPPPGGG